MSASLPAAGQRLCVEIKGAVQGVGFRPFVYRLATELALTGWVINNSKGVFIEVEGDQAALDSFLERLSKEKPPRAIIHSLSADQRLPLGYKQFEIRHSEEHGAKTVLVLPDVATCPDCLAEVLTPSDRRAGYPFTNCTNCGPRFSIIQALPYDRPNTTMHHFKMCPACQAEYTNPLDRRFHAQPNACPVCGPQLEFVRRDAPQSPRPAALADAAAALSAGLIVAVKGLGGFHLMVDAVNAEAVARLRQRKHRTDKPLALMAPTIEQARALVEISPQAETLLTSAEAPIVLLPRRPNAPIAAGIAPGNPYVGVMLPYTPLHHLLLARFGRPVVATSGNLSDEPICIDNDEARQRLGHIADAFMLHNRPIQRHVDDSVAWLLEGETRLLRRARGFAPLPVLLRDDLPSILAVGAHLKNTVALSVKNQVFISQHIGDLETAESMHAFERVIADFLRLYEAEPVAIAHDLHPEYLSTKWTQEQLSIANDQLPMADDSTQSKIVNQKSKIAVQHHHAHLAACLAENGETGPALGIIWDGTGFGADGAIWGGEFLWGNAADFERVAHLRPFRLPGGDAAVKEPRRVALALLWEMFGQAALKRDDLPPIAALAAAERRLLGQMLAKGINAPVTTSAGRLFDGVAALIGLHQRVNFEGQAAMALEFAADPAESGAYPLPVNSQFAIRNSQFVLDWQPLLEAILADVRRGVSPAVISARFHNALVESMVAVARQVGQETVALSGGCFQNRLLTERAALALRQAGFKVLLHKHVPPNDGGISLGQIAVAAARLAGK
ncbi:MAG: Carbamoyltransferase HypF [Anaerolineae bacterium]|nr:Carbamoyltransferase HypF [Anaerolineae bacterium]